MHVSNNIACASIITHAERQSQA